MLIQIALVAYVDTDGFNTDANAEPMYIDPTDVTALEPVYAGAAGFADPQAALLSFTLAKKGGYAPCTVIRRGTGPAVVIAGTVEQTRALLGLEVR
jgi:hypothetical protein